MLLGQGCASLGCAAVAMLCRVPGDRVLVPGGSGQSCHHRAAEFPFLLEDVGRDAVCWSSGVRCVRTLHACIPVKWALATALRKAET